MAPIDALLQIVAGTRDTLITKSVVPERGLLDELVALCSVITTVSLTVFAIVTVPAALRFRSTYRKVDHLLERIYGDINPIMRHASTISDNVNYISTSIRADIQLVNATIASANERVQRAVALTEERLNEFNALLAVVQEEAEQAFVSTASTVRGVRRGAAAFHEEDGMELASEELDAAVVADELASQLESLEEEHGYDGDPESTAAFTAAPRLRPRTRGQRR